MLTRVGMIWLPKVRMLRMRGCCLPAALKSRERRLLNQRTPLLTSRRQFIGDVERMMRLRARKDMTPAIAELNRVAGFGDPASPSAILGRYPKACSIQGRAYSRFRQRQRR